MPATPRSEIIDPYTPGTYHCWSRCVRRAFLCGEDRYTKKNFDHRRTWIEERLQYLARWFAIDITFFAILSNHLHLILRNHPDLVEKWTNKQVIRRSEKIYPSKFKEMGVKNGKITGEQVRNFAKNRKLVKELRKRLSDPSWFLRQLKQNIAVRSNKEDKCSGHFFEGRFESKAVTDEAGVLMSGLYVDLNQVRAEEAKSIRSSKRTSAYRRLMALRKRRAGSSKAAAIDGFLAPLRYQGDGQVKGYTPAGTMDSQRCSDKGVLEMTVTQYLEILDWVGRQSRRDKRGKISNDAPAILSEFNLTGELLVACIQGFEVVFRKAVGLPDSVARFDEVRKRRRRKRGATNG